MVYKKVVLDHSKIYFISFHFLFTVAPSAIAAFQGAVTNFTIYNIL